MTLEEYFAERRSVPQTYPPITQRTIEGGINWIWYTSPTQADASAWFEELTGSTPYESTISVMRNGSYGFRLRR